MPSKTEAAIEMLCLEVTEDTASAGVGAAADASGAGEIQDAEIGRGGLEVWRPAQGTLLQQVLHGFLGCFFPIHELEVLTPRLGLSGGHAGEDAPFLGCLADADEARIVRGRAFLGALRVVQHCQLRPAWRGTLP